MAPRGWLRRGFATYATHTLYAPGLRPGMTVVDVGANHGEFRLELAARVPSARFYGVEANPELARRLDGYERVFSCAATASEGMVVLHLAVNDGASSVLDLPPVSEVGATLVGTVEVPGRSLESILGEIPGRLDAVKIDIEGAEIAALDSLSSSTLRRVGQLTVEFHRHEMFHFDLEAVTHRTIGRLQRHGFLLFRFDTVDMDVVLLNRAWFGLRARYWHAMATLEPQLARLQNRWRRLRRRS